MGSYPIAVPPLRRPLILPTVIYTGSGRVGKIVAPAAVKHLTPVTLEVGVLFVSPSRSLLTTLQLGGKNPAIVDLNSI